MWTTCGACACSTGFRVAVSPPAAADCGACTCSTILRRPCAHVRPPANNRRTPPPPPAGGRRGRASCARNRTRRASRPYAYGSRSGHPARSPIVRIAFPEGPLPAAPCVAHQLLSTNCDQTVERLAACDGPEIVYKVAHERGGPHTLSPITFVLLRAASGALDELQGAASGMTVGKQEVFLIVAEIGDILAHAGSRSTVWSQFVGNS